jgi:hypothetical protein
MSELVFTTANVVQIVATMLAFSAGYFALKQRISLLERDILTVREEAREAIKVGRDTAKALADVALALAGLTGKVETLIEMQTTKRN